MVAAYHGSMEMMKLLLGSFAKVDLRERGSVTALFPALKHPEAVKAGSGGWDGMGWMGWDGNWMKLEQELPRPSRLERQKDGTSWTVSRGWKRG